MEAELAIDDITVRIAVVSGLGNTRRLLEKIESGEVKYDFVEVMACPGGCVGGGGQPDPRRRRTGSCARRELIFPRQERRHQILT